MKGILVIFIFCIPFLGFSQEQEIIDLYNQAEKYIKDKNFGSNAITFNKNWTSIKTHLNADALAIEFFSFKQFGFWGSLQANLFLRFKSIMLNKNSYVL